MPTKLPEGSLNLTAQALAALREAAPQAFLGNGKVNFDALRAALGDAVDIGRERYGLQWPGKAQAYRQVQSLSTGTLAPMPEASVRWDDTENLIIEGDNLEVLKLLQRAYHARVKMIYIDPPYNTGNEFIYPDNFREGLADYLRYSGQVDGEGFAQTSNKETSGRYHSNWLSMMVPRLFLARNLLRDDGVIFVSIDDHEVHNLRHLMDEIFGEENFVACLVWEKGRKNDARHFSVGHEYLIVYFKNAELIRTNGVIWREEKPGVRDIWEHYSQLRSKFGNDDNAIEAALADWYSTLPNSHPAKKWRRYRRVDKYGPWRDRDISWPGGGGARYDVIHPTTRKACMVPEGGWRYSDPSEFKRQVAAGLIEFREDHTEPPFRKAHIRPMVSELDLRETTEDDDGEFANQVRGSYFYKQSQSAVKSLRDLLGEKIFDNPKDHDEIARLIDYVCSGDRSAIILDFFAGSGTTAQAVLELNAKDGGNRKFILVQLPEKTDKPAYPTIADITRERVRRVITRMDGIEAQAIKVPKQASLVDAPPAKPIAPRGFRAFKLAASNFKVWDETITDGEGLARQIEMQIDPVLPTATEPGLLYELVLRAGFSVAARVETLQLAGDLGVAYSVEQGALMICLAPTMGLDLMRALAAHKPSKLVCLDRAFHEDDALKANAVIEAKRHDVLFYTA